jgi:hypothetical protein
MQASARFSKLKTLAGRVLRRGPVGPSPTRTVPALAASSGPCTARWCLAHEHTVQTELAADEPPGRRNALPALPAPVPQPG